MNFLDELLRRAYDAGFGAAQVSVFIGDYEQVRDAALRAIVTPAHVGAQSAQPVDEE